MTGKFSAESKQGVIDVMADLCEEDPSSLDALFLALLGRNLYSPSKLGFKIATQWVEGSHGYYYRTTTKGTILNPYFYYDKFRTKYTINVSGVIRFDTLEEAKAFCDEKLRKKKYVLM